MSGGWLSEARREFHATLLGGLLTRSDNRVPSNADKDSRVSVALANAILDQLGPAQIATKLPGQTAGAGFEEISAVFIRICFEKLASFGFDPFCLLLRWHAWKYRHIPFACRLALYKMASNPERALNRS